MLINTKIIDQIDGIGKKTKKEIEDHYKNLSWWKRLLGVS